ncbi:MAG: alpha/beta hydrolase [Lachnospiraceae bacterium]
MKFTKYNSLEDILSYPNMKEYLKVFYSEFLLELYPKEAYALPLARMEQIGETPWEEPFFVVVDQLVDAANLVLDIYENSARELLSLWNPKEVWSLAKEKKCGKDAVFLVAPTQDALIKNNILKKKERRPTVIICPGGGYENVCFSGEGTPILNFMEAKGYCAFILKYQVAPTAYPKPQEDLALAVKYVRANAAAYCADPDNIMILGASAGGHLCASEAALHEEVGALVDRELAKADDPDAALLLGVSARPDKVCLCYPVISFIEQPHEGSALALAGEDTLLRDRLSVERLVTPDYPPAFVWACDDDDCVPPSNARRMAQALEKAHVRHELHLYPDGGHGCGLAFSKSAHDWSRQMIEFMA